MLCIHQDLDKKKHWPTKVDTCWSSNIVRVIEAPFCLLHHHGNTLLVRMTLKKYLKITSLCNGTSWNIFYIQFKQFNIYS